MPDHAPYAFISYSRWDRRANPAIDRVLKRLREAGVNVWLAPDSVPPGKDWQGAIEAAQEQAEVHIAFFSKRLDKASGMQREFNRALDLHLPIIPILLDPADDIPDEGKLVGLLNEAIDLYGSLDSVLDPAIERLLDRLPDEVIAATPVPSRKATPRSKGYVFISYAQEDTEFVVKLRQFMRERGYGYWDYQDSDRNYHTQLFLELEDVIRNATATISVLSPDWKQSQWTVKEFLFSLDVDTPVFVAMARAMGPTLVTAGIPYIDFSDEARGFAHLDRALRLKGLIE